MQCTLSLSPGMGTSLGAVKQHGLEVSCQQWPQEHCHQYDLGVALVLVRASSALAGMPAGNFHIKLKIWLTSGQSLASLLLCFVYGYVDVFAPCSNHSTQSFANQDYALCMANMKHVEALVVLLQPKLPVACMACAVLRSPVLPAVREPARSHVPAHNADRSWPRCSTFGMHIT